jgi:hypothetical protein
MRTLRYLIDRRPRSLEDCLDLARRTAPPPVELRLAVGQLAVGMDYRAECVAELVWRFDGCGVRVRRVLGIASLSGSDEDRRAAVRGANARLAGLLARLASAGIEVTGAEQVFEAIPAGGPGRDGRQARRPAATTG